MSFSTASAPHQVVSANSFKKSFKAGPSLVRQATSKKLETGKVFRPGHAKAQAECQPSLLGFEVSPSLRKIAAEAVAAQDSHNYRVGAFSFKTNCRKSLEVAEAMLSGDVGDVVESCEQGLAPVTTERRPPGTPPQLEGEGRVKKAGGGDNEELERLVVHNIMRRVQANNRRASDPCGDSEAAKKRRTQALWDKATAEAVLDQKRREHYRPGMVRRMRTYMADMHFQSLNMLAGGTSGF